MLKELFQKNAGEPRYIDYLGKSWDSKSKLEILRAPDVSAGILASVLYASHAMMQGNTMTMALQVIVGSALAVGTHLLQTGSLSFVPQTRLARLRRHAIDRQGRAAPPENNPTLLREVQGFTHSARTGSAVGALFSAGALYADMRIFQLTGGFAPNAITTVPLLVLTAQNMHFAYLGHKLLKGDYVFCGTPPAQTAKNRVALPAAFAPKGQHA